MADEAQMGLHPPKVPLTIRVGVTGHRNVEGTEELRCAVRHVLELIRNFAAKLKQDKTSLYSDSEPILRIISPLAEGADRLVADEALKLSFNLQCPLPFFQEEYEKDFSLEGSTDEFRALRVQAESVFELDGIRDRNNEAYEAVGHVLLRQSDLLIAVWDGAPARGKGGTAQVVGEALTSEIPVIRINARSPHEVMIVRSFEPTTYGEISELCERMRNIYALPDPLTNEPIETPGRKFFKEKQPQWSFAIFYRLLCKLLLWRIKWPHLKASFDNKLKQQWQSTWAELSLNCGFALADGEVRAWVDNKFLEFFAWSDGLADVYGARYRSSFVMNYFMAASVVLVAFVGHFSELLWPRASLGVGWTLAELSLILSILVLTRLGRHFRWHERWMDYRWLAEGFRQMQFLAPLGRVMPAFRLPAHLEFGDPRLNWANWYVRGAVRHAGMIDVRMTPDHLACCRKLIASVARSQVNYHRKNALEAHKLGYRIQRVGLVLFNLAFIGCILHLADLKLIFGHQEGWEWLRFVIGLIVIVLPAFGAAFAAISHHAEFERLAARSHALEIRLNALASQVSDNERIWTSQELGHVAEDFSRILLSELNDWRYVFLDKQLTLPL
jgi:hypothetical protein